MYLGHGAGILLRIFVGYQGNPLHSLTFAIIRFYGDMLLAVKAKTSSQPWILAPWSRWVNLRLCHCEV